MGIVLDTELLRDKTLRLLGEVGLKVEHDELTGLMKQAGCTESPSGRLRIPAELIAEFVAAQERTRAADDDDQSLVPFCGPDWTHWLMWTCEKEQVRERMKTEFLMSAFDCGPTQYYNDADGKLLPVNTEIFIEMMKLAEATPEVGYVSTWYRQDVPQATERLDSLILALQYTRKVDGIEAISPGMIKYLIEAGEIMSGNPRDGRYLAGSQCLISPLILDHRASEDMLERARCGLPRFHAASMPTIGISTPVTVAGAIVIGAAEILGCLVAGYCLDREADLTGRMISTVMDMQTADAASAGPENVAVIAGVKTLFDDHFGGHLWTETYFSPSTNQPGLQAVYQNFYAAGCLALLRDDPSIPYPGMGTLDNGGVGSPTQLMLDMEIRKSQFALQPVVDVSEGTIQFGEICARTESGDTFLTSDHTLDNFRSLWQSKVFPLTVPEAAPEGGDERRVLAACRDKWQANLESYQQPEPLADDVNRALQSLQQRAREELG